MILNTHPENRKEMVKAICELTGMNATYLFTPTYAYQVGTITVSRDGSIDCEDEAMIEVIKPMLIERGWLEAEETPEAPADSKEMPVTVETIGAEQMDITMPIPGWTAAQMANLLRMLCSKQNLINRMLRYLCKKQNQLQISPLKMCYLMKIMISEGNSFQDIIDCVTGQGLMFHSDAEIQEFVTLYQELSNHTRLQANRGNMPSELFKAEKSARGYSGSMPSRLRFRWMCRLLRRLLRRLCPRWAETIHARAEAD